MERNLSPVPVQANERIQVIDVLRGFAILGILLFNMRGFAGQAFPASSWPEALDKAIVILLDFLVQAKFYSLFSFLFGWGMAVQMRRMEARGKKFFPVYLRRMILLLIFGALHKSLLWTGDILLMYAILGIIILLIFRKLSPRFLLITAILFLVLAIVMAIPGEVMDSTREWCANVTSCISTDWRFSEAVYRTGTYWEVTQFRFQELRNGFRWFPCNFGPVIAMMLLGLYTGKRRIFENFEIHQKLFRQIMWAGLIIGVILNGFFALISAFPLSTEYYALIRIGSRTIGAPALTLFYVTGITLLYQEERWKRRLAPLGHVGRMALTNYISHSIFLPWFFYGYGLGFYGLTDPTFGLIFTLVIYRAQIQFSQWWFERYQFGPLEWLWRTLTYAVRLPISVEATYDSLNKLTQKQRRNWTAALVVLVISVISAGILFGNQRIVRRSDHGPVEETQAELAEDTEIQTQETESEGMSAAYAEAIDSALQAAPVLAPDSQNPDRLEDVFDPEAAYGYIETLSSDRYQGRYSGSPTGLAAGDYIASQFEHFGLKPVGSPGSYFQYFPLESLIVESEPTLRVMDQNGEIHDEYQMHNDFIPELGAYSGPGRVEGQAIWAVDCTRENFHEIEAVGRIVFCRAGDLQRQMRLAVENRAAGLLLLTDQDSRPPSYRNAYLESWIPEPIPVFQVYPNVAADILASSGYSIADLSILYEPIDLNPIIQMEVAAHSPCEEEYCTGRNLLGIIPGNDPEKKDRVIILSASYDGLGMAPDGTIWPGANYGASGISVLLEIAHSWQDEGFAPGVTVLFAAWDAREQELQGLDHFLHTPIYPLENTTAIIHLDQIGTGTDILQIIGEGAAGQIQAAAGGIDVQTTVISGGSGEADLLLQKNLPYSVMKWEQEVDLSQTPADTIDTIQLDRLDQAGTILGLVIYQLSEVPTAIDALLSRRCEAITNGSLQHFLDTTAEGQAANDRNWFEDVRTLEPESCEMTFSDLRVTGSEARAAVTINLEIPLEEGEGVETDTDIDTRTFSIHLPALFKFEQKGWRWAGAQLSTGERASFGMVNFTIHRSEENAEPVEGLALAAAQEYFRIASLLSLDPGLKAQIYVYPSANILKADTRPSMDGYLSTWVGENSLKFSSNPLNDIEDFRDSFSHLLLVNYGIPQEGFAWLWEGLPLLLENPDDQILQQSDKLIQLQGALSENEVDFNAETSWAAVEYLHQSRGFEGLGEMIEALGNACSLHNCETEDGSNQALIDALGMDQDAFDVAWISYWQVRLGAAQAELDAVLTQRADAVLNGDEAAFLETVDPRIRNLLMEEKGWFADLSDFSPDSYQLSGNPIAILESGEILADVAVRYILPDVQPPLGRGSFTFEILFNPSEDGFLWAGPIFQSVSGKNLIVRYPAGLEETANAILDDAGEIYGELADALSIADPDQLTINLYEDKFLYRSSIALSFPAPEWIPGWTAPGVSIKLLLDDPEEAVFQRALVMNLSRQALMQIGVRDEWILTGGSYYLSEDAAGGLLQRQAEVGLIRLVNILSKDTRFDLVDFPDLYHLSEYDYPVAVTLAWDSMGYFADQYGQDALTGLFFSGNTTDLENFIRSSIQHSAADFMTDWKDSFLRGHISAETLDIALQFNAEDAQKHIDYLTDHELAGRQAGSPGGDQAADYIEDAFLKAGLNVSRQYFQVPYQTYLDTPSLDLTINGRYTEFVYREDFLVLQIGDASDEFAGQLVWIADENYAGMELDGKIAVRKPEASIEEEIENAASHGASALILVGDKNRDQDLLTKYPFSSSITGDSIPVIELTDSGFKQILDLLDINLADLYHDLPATLLDGEGQLKVPISEPVTSETSNVIGFLPGSDPDLQDEVIIVGAHYDHVGYDPGTPYSGVNDNASGVAALLEIAQLLQREGYQPGRSVVFVAWGAQEAGELGSQYYLSNPVFPLEDTVAVLQLDAIGGGDGYYIEAQGSREKDAMLLYSFEIASELAETRLYISPPQSTTITDPAYLHSPASLFDSPNMKITSDDVPFRQANIPVLLIKWKEASESNLPDLIADPVLPERLENSGKTIFAALLMLAR